MVLEAVRIVADWLEDATNGVNAKIALVDIDAADSAPPEVARVLDVTRDGEAARGDKPADWPVLVVGPGGLFEMVGEVGQTHRRASGVPVAIGYINGDGDDAEAMRDAEYTLRAVQMSVRELMKNANLASRTRNNVCLMIAQRFLIDPLPTTLETGLVVTASMRVDFTAQDSDP